MITWTDKTHGERTGEVWSPGPTDDTLWVIPTERLDGEGFAVCVHRLSRGRFEARKVDIGRSGAEQHGRVITALCDRLLVPGTRGDDGCETYGFMFARGGQLTGSMPGLAN